jgi:formylglycine-generating enzyme required for sulfatase activity
MIEIPAGRATLGLPRGSGQFGWDNEFEEHTVEVPAFAISKYNATNGRFLEFMADGGYERPELWSPENWQWLEHSGIQYPQFWTRRGEQWFYRGMFEEIPLPADWPVYISYAEASAYAKWAGGALPSEAQFHRAAYGTPSGEERAYPWGDEAPAPRHGNFDFARWDPAPAGAYPAGDSAFGVADLLGNGWEWTSTLFEQFVGFKRFSFYPGYSADFFDRRHYVMKGGSARTAGALLRHSFRNWFQPRYPYVYATFRVVEER